MINATDNTKNRFALIDALRCLAAVWVVLFHFSEGKHIPTLLATIPEWLKLGLFDAGHLGVPIFFVLSGVVMAYTTKNMSMTTNNGIKFLLRRFVRLMPPYYAAVVLGVLVLTVKHKLGQQDVDTPSLRDVFVHLFFLQDIIGVKNIIPVFWTLCIEVQFYIALAGLLWMADKCNYKNLSVNRDYVIKLIAIIVMLWPLGIVHSIGWHGGFIGFWFSFLAGVLCAQVIINQNEKPYFAIGYSLFLLVIGIIKSNSFICTSGFTGLLICFVFGNRYLIQLLSKDLFQKIGLISYSLYLFHTPVTGSFMRLYRHYLPTSFASDFFALIISVFICIMFATVTFKLFERPAISLSRQIKFERER